MSAPTTRIDARKLGKLDRLNEGGQGIVYRIPGMTMEHTEGLVYKEYAPAALKSLDIDALDAMPAYLESLLEPEGLELLSRCAWPCRLVERNGEVTGFVMPLIPDEFFTRVRTVSGDTRTAAEVQLLLNPPDFIARRRLKVSERIRYELLADAARGLAFLHDHQIFVGDVSPRNLMFSLTPHRKVFFLDCDSMRFRGRSAVDQVETPHWDVETHHPGEPQGTFRSDSYKLALLALRLLAGDQTTRNPARLPATTPKAVRALISDGLQRDPQRRPGPRQWIDVLVAAGDKASTSVPAVPASPGSTNGGQRSGRPPTPPLAPRPRPVVAMGSPAAVQALVVPGGPGAGTIAPPAAPSATPITTRPPSTVATHSSAPGQTAATGPSWVSRALPVALPSAVALALVGVYLVVQSTATMWLRDAVGHAPLFWYRFDMRWYGQWNRWLVLPPSSAALTVGVACIVLAMAGVGAALWMRRQERSMAGLTAVSWLAVVASLYMAYMYFPTLLLIVGVVVAYALMAVAGIAIAIFVLWVACQMLENA